MKRRVIQVILLVLYVGLIGFFTYQCLQTGAQSTNSSNVVGNVVADTIEVTTPIEIDRNEQYFALIRKLIGHYGYFVILGGVSFLLYHSITEIKLGYRLALHLGIGFIFAFISEFLLEASADGRGPSFGDVMIDYSGFLTLSLIFVIIILIIHLKKRKANG
ncbi:MAG: VanZ family protein [Bacilli bacterium]|nr:VanZ family protein [Bacilli bacterium]